MSVASNITAVRRQIPQNVRLICVSKFQPVESILEAYNAGERIFGESRVQELSKKQPLLPGDIRWHFIGHLQSNKIKHIAPFVSMIHSVDSFELLCEINRHALKCRRTIDVLLQVHIAGEDTKFGFSAAEIPAFLKSGKWKELTNTAICGLMGMASFTADNAVVISEFQMLARLFDTLKKEYFADCDSFCELSMGMTGDFPLAIGAGSTMVRIGSAIFGERK